MLEQLKKQVCEANLRLVRHGLVTLTWGNVSGIDRERRLVVIKPSGISYDKMQFCDMPVLDLDGKVVEGNLKPSSDTPAHLELYRAFVRIGGITHTHSTYATIFAQAQSNIPCFGTTHADTFYGEVPVTRPMTSEEVAGDYEASTGRVIVERFAGLNPSQVPAVLVASHGPFTWGLDALDAVRNALSLEKIARMALGTMQINPEIRPAPQYLLDKHYLRKHGPNAYYGQEP